MQFYEWMDILNLCDVVLSSPDAHLELCLLLMIFNQIIWNELE
jgi:hypothetical protein